VFDDQVTAYLNSLPGRAAHQRAVARDAVSASAIRTWCDAMGELHPVFLDPSVAKERGHPDVLVPPATLQMWTLPGLEPGRPPTAGPARPGDRDEEVRARLAEFGYPATLAVSTNQEFTSALRVGDLLMAEDVYVGAAGRKQTSLGPGYFVTHRTSYTTAQGGTVGRVTTTLFHFSPRPAAALQDPPAPPKGPIRLARPATPGNLVVGSRLDPVLIPVTPTLIIAGACATRDFYPVHHDRDFARSRGAIDILMNIFTTNGLLARVIGEWTSHAGLQRLFTRLRAPAYPYDELSVTGVVRSAAGGQAELTVRAATRDRVHADAVAVVGVPG
jgi:acyl dehydratase